MTTRCPLAGGTANATGSRYGFALVDVVIVVAMLSTLLTLAVPIYKDALVSAKVTLAVREIEELQEEIELHRLKTGALPASLAELAHARLVDPWGNPYHYAVKAKLGDAPKGGARLDRFLRPLNSAFDLYSSGPDGQSTAPLTARVSRDDIVLANDGQVIGVAGDL